MPTRSRFLTCHHHPPFRPVSVVGFSWFLFVAPVCRRDIDILRARVGVVQGDLPGAWGGLKASNRLTRCFPKGFGQRVAAVAAAQCAAERVSWLAWLGVISDKSPWCWDRLERPRRAMAFASARPVTPAGGHHRAIISDSPPLPLLVGTAGDRAACDSSRFVRKPLTLSETPEEGPCLPGPLMGRGSGGGGTPDQPCRTPRQIEDADDRGRGKGIRTRGG